jgi:hypothetical protein
VGSTASTAPAAPAAPVVVAAAVAMKQPTEPAAPPQAAAATQKLVSDMTREERIEAGARKLRAAMLRRQNKSQPQSHDTLLAKHSA